MNPLVLLNEIFNFFFKRAYYTMSICIAASVSSASILVLANILFLPGVELKLHNYKSRFLINKSG